LKSWLTVLGLMALPLVHADLLDAVDVDDGATARQLIEAGADVRAANRYGVAPLSLACRNGNAALVKLLLEKGAEANTRMGGGETALMTAARAGCVDCVRLLLDAGAEVDAKERRGQTALMWAAAEGHAAVVALLLERGADFRTPLKSGFTPLTFAAREGRIEVVRLLLKAGADVNEVTPPGEAAGRRPRTGSGPLILAVENGHLKLALALVDAGADPNDQRSGFGPLHAVAALRKPERGEDEIGLPPPEGSGRVTSLEFVRELVGRGADVNARLKSGSGGGGQFHLKGSTPFLLAARTCDLPLMRLLLELGADPTLPNIENCLPLAAAAGVGVTAPGEEPGSEEEAKQTILYLMELGADINAVDGNGETAMHGAAYKCMAGLVNFLHEQGADIAVWNRKNKHGWTPLLIAQGYRPGNFRPIQETTDALTALMIQNGVDPPAAPSPGS
jgi:uncharacterized protein